MVNIHIFVFSFYNDSSKVCSIPANVLKVSVNTFKRGVIEILEVASCKKLQVARSYKLLDKLL